MRKVVGSFVVLFVFACASAPAYAAPQITTLSTRADLVSGGDALVAVDPAGAQVSVDGRNVTALFASRRDGRYEGLLSNLPLGDSVVTAKAPDGSASQLVITNHPLGGPVLAGPQIQPWTCFDGSLDKQCNRPVDYAFFYKSTQGGSLKAYDPESPPSDVATTKTDQGRTVPFIVREETGTIDRDQYRIAVLYNPKQPWAAVDPQDGFNHKAVIFHGASCDTAYTQAQAPDVLNETALGLGFATMSHALDNAGHNCNIVTQGEALIMTKEHLIDTYGALRYTIGSGCSGGSLVQQQLANAYPGLYQGITPQCSFTDAWSSSMQYVDFQLLRRYFEDPSRWAAPWDPHSMAEVEGHISPLNAVTFTEVIPSGGDPSRSCPGLASDQVFDEKANPRGVRCSLQDYMVNVFGKRAQDGYAQRPADNVGVEYGRKALQAGTITASQFVDVNAKLGGYDINYNETPKRVEADRPALERVYQSGAVDQADNLDKVAIIDLRGPDPGAFHDVYRTYVMRARLMRNFGTAANQILWRGQVPLLGDTNYVDQSIVAIDGWLANVEKDPRDLSLARKIIDDKPKDLTDRCTDGNGQEVPAQECDAVVQAYSDPRLVAGMPMANDTIKCELKPLDRASYAPATFTDAEWKTMQQTYPNGVCDYSKPGVDRKATVPWQTYQDHDGNVIYGGRALGAVPTAGPVLSLGLRSVTSCVSRRSFRIRVRAPRGQKLRSARVYLNGRRVKVRGGRATINLRGLPSGTARVKIVAVTRKGKRYVAARAYRTCTAKR
jgi:hypothetical protein